MNNSNYDQSFQYLITTFNAFAYQAYNYVQQFGSSSNHSLQQLYSEWMHPQGLYKLMRTIADNHQMDIYGLKVFKFINQNFHGSQRSQVLNNLFEIDRLNPSIQAAEPGQNQRTIDEGLEVIPTNNQSNLEIEEAFDIQNEDVSSSSSEEENVEDRASKRGPYKKYTMAEKMQAVQLYNKKEGPTTALSKQLGIPLKNIRRWATNGIYRKKNIGRGAAHPALQEKIYDILSKQYAPGEAIEIDKIQSLAIKKSKDPDFKASRGWLRNFAERFELNKRNKLF